MRERPAWQVGLIAAAGVVWLLAVDALLNVTTGLFDLSAHRWWLLGAAITVSIITGVSVAFTRAETTSTPPHPLSRRR